MPENPPHPEDVVDLLLSRLQDLEGVSVTAEYPRLRREVDGLVMDLDGAEAVDAGEKLLHRRAMVDRYASQYLESSP